MRRIVCFVLGLGTFCLASSTEVLIHGLAAPVQYVPLGSKVTIPCDSYGDRRAGKWLHRNDDNGFTTIAYEISGITFKSKHLLTRIKTIRNFSLEISPFIELDKGTYFCQTCSTEICTDGKPITLLPQFELFSTALHKKFIMAGDLFSYSCLYNLTQKADWRFKGLGENTIIPLGRKFSNTNVLIISNVQPNNAGKYSYWSQTYSGQQQRMCSVDLCVLSVNAEKLTHSPQNCTLYCDADIPTYEGDMAVVETDKWNISIIGGMIKLKSSLRCRLLNSGGTHNFSLEDATATAQSYAVLPITADNTRHPPVAALISTCIGFLFIVAIALFIILWVSRQRADRNSSTSANGQTEREPDYQVTYSTLQFGRYKQQNVRTSDPECVYSQIVFTKNI